MTQPATVSPAATAAATPAGRKPTRRPEGVAVTYRKMRFDFAEQGFDRYWFAGSPFLSHFWSGLSTAFPPGEHFFMESARRMKEALDDPELVAELENFIRQEGHHTYQHILFNEMIRKHGYDVSLMEERFARPLRRAAENLPAEAQLAVTMALEHFTACFAHQFLSDPSVAAGADPKVSALWEWHAAEEAEHKATAFDVYQEVDGSYLRRVAMLPVAWGMLLGIAFANTFTMLKHDGLLTNWRDNARGLHYLFVRPGFIRRLVPSFLDYLRRDFHPWDVDDAPFIARWAQDNARYVKTERPPRAQNPSRAA